MSESTLGVAAETTNTTSPSALSLTVQVRPAGPQVVVREATAQRVMRDGRVLAVVTSPAPVDLDVLARWISAGCPEASAPRQAFAAVLADPVDGSVVSVSTSRTEVSLFYTWTPDSLILSSRLRGVVDWLPVRPDLNIGKLADLTALFDDPENTVFAGVQRLPTGHLLRWRPGQRPVLSRWFRPEETEPIRLTGPDSDAFLMRAAVRSAVQASLPASGDVAASVSGGLDSTMVAAMAAEVMCAQGRVVHGATHVPLPGTAARRVGWEPDDGPYAELLAEQIPGLTFTPIINRAKTSPLEVLTWEFDHTYAPTMNATNAVWWQAICRWAQSLGCELLLGGDSGNASFSRDRAGVRQELFDTGRWLPILRDLPLQHRAGESWAAVAYSLAGVVSPKWVHAARNRWRDRGEPSFARQMPLRQELLSEGARAHLVQQETRTPTRSRTDWLRWVLEDPSLTSSVPDVGPWQSDPLSDPVVVRTACSLPLESWIGGGLNRSVARRAMAGLVPDEIRLRATRGEQSADFGRWIIGRDQEYRDAVDEVAASPSANQFIDVPALRASIATGLPAPGPLTDQWDNTHGRALTLGLFAAWWDKRTARTPALRSS